MILKGINGGARHLILRIVRRWDIWRIRKAPQKIARRHLRHLISLGRNATVPYICRLLDEGTPVEADDVRLLWALGEVCSDPWVLEWGTNYRDAVKTIEAKIRAESRHVRDAAFLALAKFKAPYPGSLVAKLLAKGFSEEGPFSRCGVEIALVDHVARFGDPEDLIKEIAIQPGNESLRRRLVEMMDTTLSSSFSKTNEQKTKAVEGMKFLRAENEIIKFVEVTGTTPSLRSLAISALRELGGLSVREFFLRSLGNPGEDTELLAEILVPSSDQDLRALSLDALREHIKSGGKLTPRIVDLLGEYGRECDTELLIARLGAVDDLVRRHIGRALTNLGESSLGAVLTCDDVRDFNRPTRFDFNRLTKFRDHRLIRPLADWISNPLVCEPWGSPDRFPAYPHPSETKDVERWLQDEFHSATADNQRIITQAFAEMRKWREQGSFIKGW